MALLGNGWDDPQTGANLALAAGMIRGDFGGGLLGASQAYSQARDDALKRQYMQAQMQDIAQQVELRKQQAAQLQRRNDLINGWLSGGIAPTAGGGPSGSPSVMGGPSAAPVASGAPGAMSAPEGSPLAGIPREAVTADLAFNDGKGIAQWMYERNKPNIEFINGVAVDKNRVMPGASLPQMSPTGQGYQIMPDASVPGGFRVIMPEGADQVYGRFKAIDAGINAQMTPEKVYNPQTQREEYRTRAQVIQQAQPPAGQPTRMGTPEAAMRAQVQGDMGPDPAAIQRELQQTRASLPFVKDAASRQQLEAYMADLQRQAAALPQSPMAAGQSVPEATAAAAAKEQAVKQAADVAEQRKSIMNAGFIAPTNIARYQQIGKLLADVDGGKYTPMGTEFASALNGFGVKIDKNLPNKQAAAALANQAALELRNPANGAGMPGSLSDSDRNFLTSMAPNMAQSAEGRKLIIDSYIALQQRNAQVAQFARNYEKKYGRLDNGFFDQLSAWSSAHPLFKGQ